jgi:putative transcription factor
MQSARMDLKLSQKDVAQKINEKPSVLQDYEAGKAVPNSQILAKLERVLAVKLRGTSKNLSRDYHFLNLLMPSS